MFDNNELFCDVTDDFNFYKCISNIKDLSINIFETLN